MELYCVYALHRTWNFDSIDFESELHRDDNHLSFLCRSVGRTVIACGSLGIKTFFWLPLYHLNLYTVSKILVFCKLVHFFLFISWQAIFNISRLNLWIITCPLCGCPVGLTYFQPGKRTQRFTILVLLLKHLLYDFRSRQYGNVNIFLLMFLQIFEYIRIDNFYIFYLHIRIE